MRLERQEILTRDGGPEVKFILSESALRRNLGDPAMMREQLTQLTRLSRLPTVTLQVFPFAAQTYAPMTFGFTILRFGEEVTSDVIYTETFTDADYVDRQDVVRAHTRLRDRLVAAPLGPVESRRLIRSVANETK